jgi:hypothetical protein
MSNPLVRWLTGNLTAAANSRRTVMSQVFKGPILIRGGSWGGMPASGACGMDFGYIETLTGTASTHAGRLVENNAPLANAVPYTRFQSERLHNDISSIIEGFPEWNGGPDNYRPLHFVIPRSAGVAISFWNGTAGAITVGFNVEIVEDIPQAYLDCLRHLVM